MSASKSFRTKLGVIRAGNRRKIPETPVAEQIGQFNDALNMFQVKNHILDLVPCIFSKDQAGARNCRRQYGFQAVFGNPYNTSGLRTRINSRVAVSGAHSWFRSKILASFGLTFALGCGQSLPQMMRSGAALT